MVCRSLAFIGIAFLITFGAGTAFGDETGASAPAAPPASPPPAQAATPEERLTFNGYFNVESDYQLTTQGLGDRKGSIDVDVLEFLLNYKSSDKFRLSAAAADVMG